jgi:uncharacterized protein YprB with RNaseH-like and TPR domain
LDEEFRKRLQSIDWDSEPDRRITPPARLDLAPLLKGTDRSGVFVLERSYSEFASPEENDFLLSSFRGLRERGSGEDLPPEVKADELLFVDIEATGFIGNIIFLLGVLSIEPEGAILKQVFARDYTEEKALLDLWLRMVTNHPTLVSFNGKTYDLPFIRDRIAFHRMNWDEDPAHVDLLHLSRRKWKSRLPDCKLKTLEYHVCGRRRLGDIPSAEIPYVYHEFVRTGDPEEILKVFHHNALDVITMAELMLKLWVE